MPYLDELALNNPTVKIVKENCDLNIHEDVEAVPTFFFYINGQKVEDCRGINKNIINMWLDFTKMNTDIKEINSNIIVN
jgi:hypothetical protein